MSSERSNQEKMRYGYGRMTLSMRDLANKMHATIARIMWYEDNMPVPSDEYSDHSWHTDALNGEVFSALYYQERHLEDIEMKQRQLWTTRTRWMNSDRNKGW